jgi:hypothetical protein
MKIKKGTIVMTFPQHHELKRQFSSGEYIIAEPLLHAGEIRYAILPSGVGLRVKKYLAKLGITKKGREV